MENLEMLVVNENGQMEINFEALEMVTSSEFVLTVKKVIFDMGSSLKNIDITNDSSFCFVHLHTSDLLITISYTQRNNSIDFTFAGRGKING